MGCRQGIDKRRRKSRRMIERDYGALSAAFDVSGVDKVPKWPPRMNQYLEVREITRIVGFFLGW
jgi:hypothetical protein